MTVGAVPEVRDGRAGKGSAENGADAVDGYEREQEPADAADRRADEEALELAQDGGFDEGEAEVVDHDADPEWLFW